MTARAETIETLRQRVHQMQGGTTSRPLPTSDLLAPVLQLRTGTSYGTDSPWLAMLMMAGPSRAGAWSAVVGVPDFGLEAAQRVGVALERTVWVPEPGEAWWTVLGALAEVMGVVVVRPPHPVSSGQAERLSSRLRGRETVLVALDDHGHRWPRVEARVSLRDSVWSGIGHGHGRLVSRRATVVATRGGRQDQSELWEVDDATALLAPDPSPHPDLSRRPEPDEGHRPAALHRWAS